jgi:YidC/Oxa1 family membrane protein insertase
MQIVSIPFGWIMRFCYNLFTNYGLAVILFTLITKILLLPVALWTQQNSVRLIKIQPQLNFIKAKYYGDKDKISDEQLALYKREKYNPFVGIVPMLVQLFLLMCLIQIIYNPLTHILALPADTINTIIDAVVKATGISRDTSSIQLAAVTQIQNGVTVEGVDLSSIKAFNLNFLGFDLSLTPFKTGGKYILVPIAAGAFSLLLSFSQNIFNPLQAEQNRLTQYSTAAVSVGISLILGGFVPAGIGFYWIISNLFTIIQQFLLNIIINPKKHIDYDELEKSRQELAKVTSLNKTTRLKHSDENYKRQKADCKRFYSVANKHFVIYAEGGGFYKYFEHIISYLLGHSNIVIHYITSDPNDNIFNIAENEPRIKAYYISPQRMITVFMKMDADIVLMTTPDLENFQYKRSYIKKDTEYIFTPHFPMSTHMVMNNRALDHFDTIFCVGDFQISEIRKQEEIYRLPAKNLVVCGYGFLEKLYAQYQSSEKKISDKKKILIAPSWQEDNILDSCIDDILDILLGKGFEVCVRPHPEYIKRYSARLENILSKYSDYAGDDLDFELDFTDSTSIYNSDLVITDWSGTAYEFSYVTLKPSVFINTKPKIYNKEYEQIGIEPLEITLRNKVGKSFDPDRLDGLYEGISDLLNRSDEYADIILKTREKYVANFGESGKIAGNYIISSLIDKANKRKDNK